MSLYIVVLTQIALTPSYTAKTEYPEWEAGAKVVQHPLQPNEMRRRIVCVKP